MTKKNAKVKAANESDEYLDELKHRIQDDGLTLSDAMAKVEHHGCTDPYDRKYVQAYIELAKLRFDYIRNHPEASYNMNFYIDTDAEGGELTVPATVLMLGFVFHDYEHPFFLTGDPEISFDDYAGEPIILLGGVTASDLLRACGDRGVSYILNDLHMTNFLTLIAGPESYEEFLSGLGDKYIDRDGKVLTANNIASMIGRF